MDTLVPTWEDGAASLKLTHTSAYPELAGK